MKTKQLLQYFSIVLIAITSYACSYDNTLYNARKYFKTAQARALNQQGLPTPQAVDDYNKTIRKTGFILTERPNSKQADDALILLAKALYYKGNSQFQAKDQFQNLIDKFPDSPYVSEAYMYLAKTYRQINQPQAAENILVGFIRNSKYSASHPQAMLLLADFAMQDKDQTKSQYWLQRLLSQYPRSLASKEAFFLLGKIYYEQEECRKSIIKFKEILDTKGISKQVKLDARFYIALNQLLLGEIQESMKTTLKLKKDEDRPEKLSQISILQSRILLESGKEDQAIDLLQSVIRNSPRSNLSAEAYYWLAEYYFYDKNNITAAIENYNKSRTESSSSQFVTSAGLKHSALSSINQKTALSYETNPRQFVEGKLEIADYYIRVFNLPDSAFSIFDAIISLPIKIQLQIDSLQLELGSIRSNLQDSLYYEPKPDSLGIIVIPDTVNSTQIPDSINQDINLQSDKLLGQINQSGSKRNEAETLAQNLETKKSILDNAITVLKDELIPYTLFVKGYTAYQKDTTSPIVQAVQSELSIKYPSDKYTVAFQSLIDGKQVRIIDRDLEDEEIQLDLALANIITAVDSSVAILERLTDSNYESIKIHAHFRLGWHYLFESQDTVKVKEHFNEVLRINRNSEFGQMVLRVYNGINITIDTKHQNPVNAPIDNTKSMPTDNETDSIQQDILKDIDTSTADDKPTNNPKLPTPDL